MPDTKISGLVSLAGASIDAAADLIPIVDVSATTAGSKKTTVNDIKTAMAIQSAPTNLWIGAAEFIPRTTSGCGINSLETTTNDANYDTLEFDAGSDEYADAWRVMPNNWNYGTVTARFYWTAASVPGGTDTVQFALSGLAYGDDVALDTASGTAVGVLDTLLAAGDMHVSSATSAITIAGTPAANKPVRFTLMRDVSEDGLAIDASFIGVEVTYTAS